jgi:hypothetical protein
MLGTEFFGLTEQAAITAVNLKDVIERKAIASFLQSLANKFRVFTNQFNIQHLQALK